MDKKQTLKNLLIQKNLDAVFISSPAQIINLTGFSAFSAIEREAFLVITKDKDYILTDGRYSEAVISEIPDFKLLEISVNNSLGKILKLLIEDFNYKSIAIEEDNITYKEYKVLAKYFNQIEPLELNHLRSIKSASEVELISQACKIGDQAFDDVLKKIKPGVSEKQISFEIEYFIKKQGAEISFPTIVAFGRNSSVPHHHTGETKLSSKKGQFILLDFGVRLNNYCSDMTRTLFWGKLTKQQEKMYQAVLQSQQQAIDFIQDSISKQMTIKTKDVDKVARDFIMSKGYPSIPHSLGHGVGLEVHEFPSLSPKSEDILKLGMVFSIEPGIYIPNFGGVRIEDLFVIDKESIVQLTKSSKSIIQLLE